MDQQSWANCLDPGVADGQTKDAGKLLGRWCTAMDVAGLPLLINSPPLLFLLQIQDSAARLLATLSASSQAAVLHIAQGVGLDLLLQLLRSPACSSAALGNISLCIGDLAKQPALLPTLQQKDAVAPLLSKSGLCTACHNACFAARQCCASSLMQAWLTHRMSFMQRVCLVTRPTVQGLLRCTSSKGKCRQSQPVCCDCRRGL